MNNIPILNYLPEKWRGWAMLLILASPYLTRAYHALSNGGGVRGVFAAIWLGTNMPKGSSPGATNQPNPPTQAQPPAQTTGTMKTMTLIGLLALPVALLTAGCASRVNLTSPPPTHIVHAIGSVKQLGIASAPQTGQATLGYQSGLMDLVTVPVQLVQIGTNQYEFVSPEVNLSYEIKASSTMFGAAGSTYTIAIGPKAVETWLGGQHYPINSATNFTVQAQPAAVLSTNTAAK